MIDNAEDTITSNLNDKNRVVVVIEYTYNAGYLNHNKLSRVCVDGIKPPPGEH